MPEDYFTGRIAQEYETRWPYLFEPAVVDPAVDFLTARAGTGPVLELGVGTGRIALPLSRRGLQVHGIELSPPVVAQLRSKPGAEAIGVTVGDFATVRVEGTFSLAYLVRNTIMNLTTQDEQVACSPTSPPIWSRAGASSWRSWSPNCAASHPARRCTRSR